jgi:hypothetical protein
MKPTTAKSKGRETENIWVDYLKTWGLANVERRRLMGSYDQGDVSGWPRVCSEVKSGAKLNIMGWLRELDAEIVNSQSETGYIVVRPKGFPKPEDWFVVMRTDAFMELMKKAGYL